MQAPLLTFEVYEMEPEASDLPVVAVLYLSSADLLYMGINNVSLYNI